MDKLRSQIGGVSLKAIYRSSISEVVSEHGEIDITEKEAMEARESAVSNSRETVFSVYKKVRIYQSTIDEFNRGKHDNGGYLRDLMISIGPVRAEKLKKAILSGSIYIGCNLVVEKEDYKPVHLKTEDMTIAGPGSKCSYQIPVHPKIVRYLSKPMLNQLREATCLEESAHLPRFISLIQLGYTLYEIIRGSGDSWSKIILGIFTIMSILQTASLFFLPMQVSAFSIESDLERDRAYYEKQGIQNIDIYNVNNFNGAMAHISEEVEGSEKKNARVALQVLARSRVPSYLGLALFVENKTRLKSLSTQPSGKWELCVLSSGVVVPLLFGIIAGYERHTTTQWLVIAWICSSIPFTFLRLFFLEPDLINSKTFIPMMLVMVLPGISLILAATICSYLP
ncbi:hypothetical protein CLU79DRAFT_752292 [Phycomyces nitens]|nr:hypothetical protein CLU79DRAFT_752292 [Phycomyces nitens]